MRKIRVGLREYEYIKALPVPPHLLLLFSEYFDHPDLGNTFLLLAEEDFLYDRVLLVCRHFETLYPESIHHFAEILSIYFETDEVNIDYFDSTAEVLVVEIWVKPDILREKVSYWIDAWNYLGEVFGRKRESFIG